MENLIGDRKILICAGSGGVGKTTVSAALGVWAAQSGRKVLVLTIDPARRLATALGLRPGLRDFVRVPEQSYAGELHAGVIDPESAFADFVREAARDPAAVERILSNPLYRQLSTTFSGSQEFTSLDRLYQAAATGHYDLILLDTPPAQHAIDFLKAPEKIYALFQSSVTKWFMEPPERQGFLQKIVSRGTQTVLSAFERVTGSEFIGELGEFFKAVQGIQDRISARSIDTHRLLVSPQCGFLLVTGFDEIKLEEATDFAGELLRGGHHLSGVIVNRAFPPWMGAARVGGVADGDEKLARLAAFHGRLEAYYAGREDAYATFRSQLAASVPILRIPDFSTEMVGLSALEELATEIERRSRAAVEGRA